MADNNTPTHVLEQSLLAKGFSRIIGIDEVGRGAFAGPVYVCGFIYEITTPHLVGVKDSKKLSKKKRVEFFQKFVDSQYTIKIGSVDTINKIGIGKTIEGVISEIIQTYNSKKTYFLLDGYFKKFTGTNYYNLLQIKGGDNKHYSIASASIIAKVLRDNFMTKISPKYPNYHFKNNVGYGTATHIQAIKTYGITKLHRTSFRPISEFKTIYE